MLPITHATFLVGALTLAGFPLLSGFWSKDEILLSAFRASEVSGDYASVYMVLFVVDSRSFWGLCEEAPSVSRKIMKAIAQRLRRVEKAPT